MNPLLEVAFLGKVAFLAVAILALAFIGLVSLFRR